jgi:hypothetical protein
MEKSIYHRKDSPAYGSKAGKIQRDDTIHYPNKNEAHLLRRIKSMTGLSEKEIRGHHRYRKMLSEAAKSGQKAKYVCDEEKFYKDLIKIACQDTGLVPQHPDTLVVLQCLIDDRFGRESWWKPYWMIGKAPLLAETVVKKYAK